MRPRVRQVRMLVTACGLLLPGGVLGVLHAADQPAPTPVERQPRDDRPAPTRAAHTRLTGELDAMACVAELEARLAEAMRELCDALAQETLP